MNGASFADPQVEAAWSSLWQKSTALMDSIQALDEVQLALAPPKGFNSLETIRHLSMTDRFEIDLIKKTPTGYAKKPRMNFLGRMVVSSMRKAKPMPTMAAMTPPSAKCTQEETVLACQEWSESLGEIRDFAAAIGSHETLLKHPLFGPMSPLDLFNLMEAHIDYHDLRLRQGGVPLP